MDTNVLQDVASHDLSLYGLFLQADIIVKIVMGLLVFLSVWTWAIAINKWLSIGAAVGQAQKFESAFWSGQPIDEMGDKVYDKPKDALARVFASVSREWQDARRTTSFSTHQADALVNRAERLMNAASDRELASMEKGLGVLATIGSASPFIGLFGTVWGIMNAFRDIGAQGSTNLAIVAPGIAEALFATALGLVAAIPAVVFYNQFASQTSRFADRLDTFTQEFIVRLSRRVTERNEG